MCDSDVGAKIICNACGYDGFEIDLTRVSQGVPYSDEADEYDACPSCGHWDVNRIYEDE